MHAVLSVYACGLFWAIQGKAKQYKTMRRIASARKDKKGVPGLENNVYTCLI